MSARPLALRLARRALSRRVLLVCIASLTSAFALLDSPLRAQAQVEEGGLQGFTPLDVARLRFATSVAIDPTGRSIAYTLYVPREPGKEPSGPGRSELWVVLPNGEPRPFVTGAVEVGGVAWTPDGRGISFLAKRNGDKARSLYVIAADGGEARRVLALDTAIQDYSWSPDGRRVAIISSEEKPKEDKELAEKGFNQKVYEEDFTQVRVWIAEVSDPFFPAENGGESANPRKLELEGAPSEIHWAPVGDRIALALAPTPLVDDFYMSRRVHVIDATSGEVVARFENPGKLGPIAWSPDAERIAFISGADVNDPNAGRLVVVPSNGGELQWVELDVMGDYDAIAWSGRSTIAYLASVGVTTRFGEVSVETGKHRVLVPEGSIVLSGLSVSRNGRNAAFLNESPSHPLEVAAWSRGNVAPRRLTDSNPWTDGIRLAPQEVVRFQARDGLELEGILIRPLDEQEGTRYPLILSVHGGPESHEKNGWLTSYSRPGQTAAARGFAVFYPNYRGSTGRGVEFSKLGQADYAGKEFDDLVDSVRHLVEMGLVDEARVGITGGSYGGYASAWAATKLTEHFAASVMFVGISDLISKQGTTDIPNEMFLVHARRSLYEEWDWFLERSPIRYVETARTPLLIIHGEEDTRVHPSQSLELYRHLKFLGNVPVRLVLYPGEGHGNRNSASRLDYNLRMLRWFEHYLQGEGGEPPPYRLDYPIGAKEEPSEENGAEEEGEEDDEETMPPVEPVPEPTPEPKPEPVPRPPESARGE